MGIKSCSESVTRRLVAVIVINSYEIDLFFAFRNLPMEWHHVAIRCTSDHGEDFMVAASPHDL